MRALSVRQPWASLIESGAKTIELRSRPTKHRGSLAIVSSLAPYDAKSIAQWGDGPRGVTLCTVEVVDCRPATPADSEAACFDIPEGAELFAWVLASPEPVERVPTKGRLGLYEVTLPE
jgi:hypothetical protein